MAVLSVVVPSSSGLWLLIALIVEVASISKSSVNVYGTIRRKNPEDSNLHSCRREKLKLTNKLLWIYIKLYGDTNKIRNSTTDAFVHL